MSQSPQQLDPESQQVIARNSRRGLLLFTLYTFLYGGFVLLMVFRFDLMSSTTATIQLPGQAAPIEIFFGGPSLAVVYGIGLIFAAIVLAVWYMIAAGRPGVRELKG